MKINGFHSLKLLLSFDCANSRSDKDKIRPTPGLGELIAYGAGLSNISYFARYKVLEERHGLEWEQRERANNSALGIKETFIEKGCNCLRPLKDEVAFGRRGMGKPRVGV